MPSSLRQRIDAFPTQLWLTVAWLIVGAIATVVLARTPYERMLLGVSFYAIVISHWTGHLAWRAKREAQGSDKADVSYDMPPRPDIGSEPLAPQALWREVVNDYRTPSPDYDPEYRSQHRTINGPYI